MESPLDLAFSVVIAIQTSWFLIRRLRHPKVIDTCGKKENRPKATHRKGKRRKRFHSHMPEEIINIIIDEMSIRDIRSLSQVSSG